MRILSILAQKPSSTGSGVYLMELVRQFSLQGQEQAVIAGVYEEDPSPFPKEVLYRPVTFKTAGLPFPIFGMSDEMPYESSRYRDMTPASRRQFADAFLQALDEVVASFSPDLILCHHLYLLTALVREHLPRHRIYGFCHNTDLRQMVKTDLERDFIRDQIRRLDRIFVPQLSQQEEVRRIFGVEEEKIRQIGIGYNQEIFSMRKKEDKRSGSASSCEEKRLIFAGKISEKKGVFSLLRALTLLAEKGERFTLTLAGGAGDLEEYERIRKMAKEAPYPVIFTGRLSQEELADRYLESDLFVLPSFFDAIPLVVIEALACSCKVVVSELPGIRSWFDANAKSADIRYVPLPGMQQADEPVKEELPLFEERLAGEMEKALHDPKSADPRAVEGVSWKALAEKVLCED